MCLLALSGRPPCHPRPSGHLFQGHRPGSSPLARVLPKWSLRGSRCKEGSVAALLQGLDTTSRSQGPSWQGCCPRSTGACWLSARPLRRPCSGAGTVSKVSDPQPLQALPLHPTRCQVEAKSMHALPGFLWLIRSLHEMQEERLAREAARRLNAGHLKLTFCSVGPAECAAPGLRAAPPPAACGPAAGPQPGGRYRVEQLLPCLGVCKAFSEWTVGVMLAGHCGNAAILVQVGSPLYAGSRESKPSLFCTKT